MSGKSFYFGLKEKLVESMKTLKQPGWAIDSVQNCVQASQSYAFLVKQSQACAEGNLILRYLGWAFHFET